MKLTKERAIAEHRKMWLWISRQIMKDYLANRTVREIYSYKCFCCEYVKQSGIDCYKDCPLYWNDKCTERTYCEHFGYYSIINRISIMCHNFCTFKEVKKMAIMAYKIAMLEEKEQ